MPSDHVTETAGHLHVVRSGALKILQPEGAPVTIHEPTALFYPRPCKHTFQADGCEGADLLCSFVEFGTGILNPLVRALPELVMVPLASVSQLGPAVDLLFGEAFQQQAGRQIAVDRLAEYFVVLLLRTVSEKRLAKSGILMGLADGRLAHAITAMHEHPEGDWSMESLARMAGMSRARFAVHFRNVVGSTPFEYLAAWRVGVAQSLLKKGAPLKMVAPAVGYSSTATLSRAFREHAGMSPTDWLSNQRKEAA